MKIYTLAECKQFLNEQRYKHVALQTSDGRDVVKYNTSKMKPEERIEQMETRLKSPTFPDGHYVFLGKYNMQRDSVPDKYYIAKGDVEALDKTPPLVPEAVKGNPDVLSYEQALKMQKKIAELTANMGAIERERDEYRDKYYELLEEVKDIADEEPDEEEELSEGEPGDMQKFIEGLATNLTPIFERHYDLKEKELEIKEGEVIAKLAKEGYTIPPAQNNGQNEQTASQQQTAVEVPELSDAELAQMTDEQQAQYRHLQLAHLAQNDPEAYQILIDSMNSGEPEPEEGLEP